MGVLVASKASETPLVVTAGQQDTRRLMSEPWLSGDLVALAQPIAKWAKEVRRGEDVGSALRRAFALARTPPAGRVFLSLPMDVLVEEVEGPIALASAAPAGRAVRWPSLEGSAPLRADVREYRARRACALAGGSGYI